MALVESRPRGRGDGHALLADEIRTGCVITSYSIHYTKLYEEREALVAAVNFLEGKLIDLGAKTHATGEKLAIMTALNIAHEFLQFQRSGGFDMPGLKRRIEAVSTRLDDVLAQQEKLF